MPTFHLNACDGLGWLESVGRFGAREACYKAAIAYGAGEYLILVNRGGDRDRELRVSADGQLTYRIPGASGWHAWNPS